MTYSDDLTPELRAELEERLERWDKLRIEIRKCNACQRATVALWESTGKREGFETCKDHTVPAPRARPALLVEDHAELHGAIAEALLAEGIDLLDNEHDMATKVMDVLVLRKVIPPPDGYNQQLEPTEG